MKFSRSIRLPSLLAGSLLATAALAAITYVTWPGGTTVATIDKAGAFGENTSGLFYQGAADGHTPVLWAVRNSPSKLYKLAASGSLYVNTTTNGWSAGKTLKYPNGSGAPDAEGITMAEPSVPAVYVATERDGKGSARFSVLRYDVGGTATTINATHEWNLTKDLPKVSDSNMGLEGIAWVPDSYLQAAQMIDTNTGLPYDPAMYDGHGTGLFFVGLENNGTVYVYALFENGSTFKRITSFASGHKQVMDLSFDRDNKVLWAYCDDNCSNRSHLLSIDTTAGSATKGKFIVRKGYNKPSGLPSSNNEGIAIAPESECVSGKKSFFWADDSEKSDHALRKGSVNCGPLF